MEFKVWLTKFPFFCIELKLMPLPIPNIPVRFKFNEFSLSGRNFSRVKWKWAGWEMSQQYKTQIGCIFIPFSSTEEAKLIPPPNLFLYTPHLNVIQLFSLSRCVFYSNYANDFAPSPNRLHSNGLMQWRWQWGLKIILISRLRWLII